MHDLLELTMDKPKVKNVQHARLQQLIMTAWGRSPFYRQLWTTHGIRQADLPSLALTDLPIIDKKIIMDNFDEVLTVSDLTYKQANDFLEASIGKPPTLCNDEYLVIRSSGSSNIQGIFVYDRKALSVIQHTIVQRMYPGINKSQQKIRYCYLGTINGNLAGETLARRTPDETYDKLLLSVLDEPHAICRALQQFQPDIIGGYASSIAELATAQLKGEIDIHPYHINCGGDPLSPAAYRRIKQAWRCSVYNIYACSESLAGIGVQYTDDQPFILFDDLTTIEILGGNNQPVGMHESGTVVMTNLYNTAMPLIRYKLQDLVVKGVDAHGFPSIEKIDGRENVHLPVINDSGTVSFIHAISLSCFFVPAVEDMQFISHHPGLITLRYQAHDDLSDVIRQEFSKLLSAQAALTHTHFKVEKTETNIRAATTGKKPLVVIDDK